MALFKGVNDGAPGGQLLATFQQSHQQSQQRDGDHAGKDDANDVVKDEAELKAHSIGLQVTWIKT